MYHKSKSPAPDVVASVIQLVLVVATDLQPPVAVIVIAAWPPAVSKSPYNGHMLTARHRPLACVTVNVCAPTMTAPLRAGPMFGAAV